MKGARVAGFRQRLLSWFDEHQRDLPWRRTKDPWAIWVSEVMLQQTRVEAVREIYPRFMQQYPGPGDFAQVDEDELLSAWRGLGYYRRARLLRDGAQAVMERHGGRVPDDTEAILDLPGIGPYTGGALASIAFGKCELAVDGNVERVTARHRGIGELVKSGSGARRVREAVAGWQDPVRPGDFNQALMELGATVCTPRSPRCPVCPLSADCIAYRENQQDVLPILPKRRTPVEVLARALLIPGRGDQVLGFRVPRDEINAGQVDLPGPGILISHGAGTELADAVRARFKIQVTLEDEAATVRHGITHHRITLTAYWASLDGGKVGAPLLRAAPSDPAVPWTTTARKVFRKVGL